MSRCLSVTSAIVPESRSFFDRLRCMEHAVHRQISAAIRSLPTELQSPVRQWFERLHKQQPVTSLPEGHADALARMAACSEFGAEVILQNWQWFVHNVDSFESETRLDWDLAAAAMDEGLEIVCEGRGGRIRISVADAERTAKDGSERIGTGVADGRLGVHDMA